MKKQKLIKIIRELIEQIDPGKAIPLKGDRPKEPVGYGLTHQTTCYWRNNYHHQMLETSCVCTDNPVPFDTWGAAMGPFDTLEECEEHLFNAQCYSVNCDDPQHPYIPYTPDWSGCDECD